jgi:hypothetical protein
MCRNPLPGTVCAPLTRWCGVQLPGATAKERYLGLAFSRGILYFGDGYLEKPQQYQLERRY